MGNEQWKAIMNDHCLLSEHYNNGNWIIIKGLERENETDKKKVDFKAGHLTIEQ
jgi:hypothetical protein